MYFDRKSHKVAVGLCAALNIAGDGREGASARSSVVRRTRECDVAVGVLGVVWFVLWMLCASESPSQHGRINTAERKYIVDTLMTEAVSCRQVHRAISRSFAPAHVLSVRCRRFQPRLSSREIRGATTFSKLGSNSLV